MEKRQNVPSTVGEYIERFPPATRAALEGLRDAIRKEATGAEERISYGMPAFYLNGVLVYFAAFKKHIGFYPTSSGVAAFADSLAGYETSKGAIRFPLGEALPLDLIRSIVRYRARENAEKTAARSGALQVLLPEHGAGQGVLAVRGDGSKA